MLIKRQNMINLLIKIFFFFSKSIDKTHIIWYNNKRRRITDGNAVIAQLVEHMLGKHEVISSNLINSSKKHLISGAFLFCFFTPHF